MLFVRFQTTYEELKPPEEIEAQRKAFELPDYLWGIETSSVEQEPWNCDSFQTTYEELKRRAKERLADFEKGSQTTYEELKP